MDKADYVVQHYVFYVTYFKFKKKVAFWKLSNILTENLFLGGGGRVEGDGRQNRCLPPVKKRLVSCLAMGRTFSYLTYFETDFSP